MKAVIGKIAQGGRLVIPAKHRRALGLKTGDEVLLRVVDGELRVLSQAEAVKRAQELVKRRVPRHRSLVQELLKERRAEALRE